ncbi:MAG TPA: cysteine peptidase family C39 domain-containing protein [Chthonomonadales bacterium]|nr:cysteine peptidase family C39 domain-containing protein [Chthonomonadales bacterium]
MRWHKYAEAAGLLDRLAARPGLTPEQAEYVRRQKQIAMNGGVAVKAAPHPSAPDALPADNECGPKALKLACDDLGVPVTERGLAKLAGTTVNGSSMAGLAKPAAAVGLKARGVQVTRQALGDIQCPAIAWWRGRHFVEVKRVSGDEVAGRALIHDPEDAGSKEIPREQLMQSSRGYLLMLSGR